MPFTRGGSGALINFHWRSDVNQAMSEFVRLNGSTLPQEEPLHHKQREWWSGHLLIQSRPRGENLLMCDERFCARSGGIVNFEASERWRKAICAKREIVISFLGCSCSVGLRKAPITLYSLGNFNHPQVGNWKEDRPLVVLILCGKPLCLLAGFRRTAVDISRSKMCLEDENTRFDMLI